MPKIKDIEKVELPREKLQRYGPVKLRDHELLAIILGSGIEGLNVLKLSEKILKEIDRIGKVKITLKELQKIKGLGQAKASQIIAIIELAKRLNNEKQEILSHGDIWKLCVDIHTSKKEHFLAFYLDTQGRLIERQIISVGTLNASLVHPREVFEPAVSLHAASIIIAHNHPSGLITSSEEDFKITDKLIKSGEILGIEIIDHVLITRRESISIMNTKLQKYVQ